MPGTGTVRCCRRLISFCFLSRKLGGGRADMILLPETHGRVEREVKGDSFSRSIVFLGESDSSSGNS